MQTRGSSIRDQRQPGDSLSVGIVSRLSRKMLLAAVTVGLTGCATMTNMGTFSEPGTAHPVPFGGLKAHGELSRATLRGVKNKQLPDGTEATRAESVVAAVYVLPYQLVDVPLSLAGDVVTLPTVLGKTDGP